MAGVLNDIIAVGGTTAVAGVFDAARITADYIAPRFALSCFVAEQAGRILGFQALEWCDPDWPGEDVLPADWAVIATFVAPEAQGKGVGKALFPASLNAAQKAGVRTIDATIRAENQGGLAYYGGLGFKDYRRGADTLSKRFDPRHLR